MISGRSSPGRWCIILAGSLKRARRHGRPAAGLRCSRQTPARTGAGTGPLGNRLQGRGENRTGRDAASGRQRARTLASSSTETLFLDSGFRGRWRSSWTAFMSASEGRPPSPPHDPGLARSARRRLHSPVLQLLARVFRILALVGEVDRRSAVAVGARGRRRKPVLQLFSPWQVGLLGGGFVLSPEPRRWPEAAAEP